MTLDTLKFGRQVPRDRGNSSLSVPLAFIEIPQPSPDTAISLVDLASGSLEDAEERGVNIAFTGQRGSLVVSRHPASPDPDTSPSASFTLTGPRTETGPDTVQTAGTKPIRVLRVEEDNSGTWTPYVSRGVFYKVWQMTDQEGESSWLRGAGIENGQYVLLQYTTELDWRLLSGADLWTGTTGCGGGALWNVEKTSAYNPTARRLNLSPAGITAAQGSSRIIALGGIKTDTGVELLAENPQYKNSTLLSPGDGTGEIGSFTLNSYPANYTNDPAGLVTQGRVRSGVAQYTGMIPVTSLASGVTTSQIAGFLSASPNMDSSVIQVIGAVFVPQEGFYTLHSHATGKIKFFHWSIAVADRSYGAPNSGVIRDTLYTGYLHSGWHDFSLEWSPETPPSGTASLSLDLNGLTGYSGPTTRSQVLSIDLDGGDVVLKQGYVVGADSVSQPSLLASYAVTRGDLPFRGYFNTTWQGLDLNPSPGRYYELNGVERPTRDWIDASCWIWLIPSLACPLTDASGTALSGATRTWYSCLGSQIPSCLRWGQVAGDSLIESGVASGSPFGSSSSFGGGVLGESVYSASGTPIGISTTYDPRGDYDSGFLIAHLAVTSGLPELSDVKIHDIRVRGGGISHEIDPTSLPAGGARERVNTYYDMSPWEGEQENTAGIALVEIPQSILDGSDGGPAWTPDEVEALVQASLAAGVKAIIKYV